jgi:hypothetical protein
MVTKREVLDLVEAGNSYDDAAARLSISAGLAYMIATGIPADGSDAIAPEDADRPGFLGTSTQHLANPAPVENPTHHDEVQRWIEARVGADAPMQHAAANDTPKPPPLGTTGEDADVVAVLARDHDQFHELTKQLQVIPTAAEGGAPDQVARRAAIVDALAAALPVHESAEEAHLWPAVRAAIPHGDDIAERAQAQESEARATLDALARAERGSEQFEELTKRLSVQMRVHVAFEDRVCLLLRDAMPRDLRISLGQRLAAAERRTDGPA